MTVNIDKYPFPKMMSGPDAKQRGPSLVTMIPNNDMFSHERLITHVDTRPPLTTMAVQP